MSSKNPLCIDCDGTLIKTDLLFEAFLQYIKENVFHIFFVLRWLLSGKPHLKTKLSEKITFQWDTIPFHEEVIDIIKDARAEGRKTVLVTASPLTWAESLAKYLDLFDEVMASDNKTNLSGSTKAAKLVERFGEREFAYAGNEPRDFKIWKHSSEAIIVMNSRMMVKKVEKDGIAVKVIRPGKATLCTYFKALRLYQWMKNSLIFVPILAGHQYTNYDSLFKAFLTFLSFGLCASTGYIINDLLDLNADRQHHRKRNRPFASCALSIQKGIALIPSLMLLSYVITRFINVFTTLIILAYFFLTLTYSLLLKKQVIVDVITLATLYTIRIIAGALATEIVPSFWLLAFSMFLFLSLAMIKRYSEMILVSKEEKKEAKGRGYSTDDLPVLRSIGTSSGLGSIMILALYINEPGTIGMYPSLYWLWLSPCFLLYWVSRIWMKAHRGEVHDDPLIFAVKDWQSRVVICLTAGVFILSMF